MGVSAAREGPTAQPPESSSARRSSVHPRPAPGPGRASQQRDHFATSEPHLPDELSANAAIALFTRNHSHTSRSHPSHRCVVSTGPSSFGHSPLRLQTRPCQHCSVEELLVEELFVSGVRQYFEAFGWSGPEPSSLPCTTASWLNGDIMQIAAGGAADTLG